MFQIATIPRHGINTNLLILLINQSFVRKRQKSYDSFPATIKPFLSAYFNFRDFKGEFKETALLYPEDIQGIDRVLIVGLGNNEQPDSDQLRELGYSISAVQEDLGSKRNHIFLGNLKCCSEELIRSLAEGILFKKYRFEDYKSGRRQKYTKGQYVFVCNKDEYTPKFRHVLLETEARMDGVNITRDLANTPANEMTPMLLKNAVTERFQKFENITIEVLDEQELIKKNFNALLGVAQGSSQPPCLIIIKYQPPKKTNKSIALVGKGVTFDSGGISIKPSANMDEMKYDMAGAAAVIGAMHVIAELGSKSVVYGIIPAVENMPGSKALKPGDVLKSYSGKTIEIVNTDAEGRLILADAMAYAVDVLKPGLIIDFATLTGAIVVALGDKMAGLFSNNEGVAEALLQASAESGDHLWRMPIAESYSKELDSEIADMKNLGGRWGGAIHAAMFLQKFIGETPWAHIDMAGTANDIKDKPYLNKGASGFGPRLLASALRQLEKHL